MLPACVVCREETRLCVRKVNGLDMQQKLNKCKILTKVNALPVCISLGQWVELIQVIKSFNSSEGKDHVVQTAIKQGDKSYI